MGGRRRGLPSGVWFPGGHKVVTRVHVHQWNRNHGDIQMDVIGVWQCLQSDFLSFREHTRKHCP